MSRTEPPLFLTRTNLETRHYETVGERYTVPYWVELKKMSAAIGHSTAHIERLLHDGDQVQADGYVYGLVYEG